MRQIDSWVLVLASLTLSTTAASQDLFSSTNSTVHSYNYLEVQYLLDIETTPPVLATLLLDASDRFSFKAEFLNQDFGNVADELGFNPDAVVLTAEAQWISIGALYHQPLTLVEKTDGIVGFMLGHVELESRAPAFDLVENTSFNFQELYVGVRRTLSSSLEGEATLNLYRDSNNTELTMDLKVVHRVFKSFDVALAGNELGGSDFFGIGLRYAW